MRFHQQLRVILYKNFLIKLRSYKQTIFEVLIVLYFIAILAIIKVTGFKSTVFPEIPDSQTIAYNLSNSKLPGQFGYVVNLGPAGSKGVMSNVTYALKNFMNNGSTFLDLMEFQNEADMDAYYATNGTLNGGLVLNFNAGNTLSYDIKMPLDKIPLPSLELTDPGRFLSLILDPDGFLRCF